MMLSSMRLLPRCHFQALTYKSRCLSNIFHGLDCAVLCILPQGKESKYQNEKQPTGFAPASDQPDLKLQSHL